MDENWRFQIDIAFELLRKREHVINRAKVRVRQKNSFRSCACIDASINETTWTEEGVCVCAYKREH